MTLCELFCGLKHPMSCVLFIIKVGGKYGQLSPSLCELFFGVKHPMSCVLFIVKVGGKYSQLSPSGYGNRTRKQSKN